MHAPGLSGRGQAASLSSCSFRPHTLYEPWSIDNNAAFWIIQGWNNGETPTLFCQDSAQPLLSKPLFKLFFFVSVKTISTSCQCGQRPQNEPRSWSRSWWLFQLLPSPLQASEDIPVNCRLEGDKQIHWHRTLWHHFIPGPIWAYWSLLRLVSKSHNTNNAAALTQIH